MVVDKWAELTREECLVFLIVKELARNSVSRASSFGAEVRKCASALSEAELVKAVVGLVQHDLLQTVPHLIDTMELILVSPEEKTGMKAAVPEKPVMEAVIPDEEWNWTMHHGDCQ